MRTLAALVVVLALAVAGCAERQRHGMGTPEHDELVSQAMDEMMRPSEAAKAPPPKGWPVIDSEAQSLEKLAQRIAEAFGEYQEVEELIYPKGWVRRRFAADGIKTEITKRNAAGQPIKATISLRAQKLASAIHATKGEAEADNDLLPYNSAQTREQMEHNPLRKRLEPWQVTIDYQVEHAPDGDNWARTGAKVEPPNQEGADWLDRIGVP